MHTPDSHKLGYSCSNIILLLLIHFCCCPELYTDSRTAVQYCLYDMSLGGKSYVCLSGLAGMVLAIHRCT